jgi:hypothetical protein
VVDRDTALGQQLLNVPVGQAVAEIPGTATVITSAGNRSPANADRRTVGRAAPAPRTGGPASSARPTVSAGAPRMQQTPPAPASPWDPPPRQSDPCRSRPATGPAHPARHDQVGAKFEDRSGRAAGQPGSLRPARPEPPRVTAWRCPDSRQKRTSYTEERTPPQTPDQSERRGPLAFHVGERDHPSQSLRGGVRYHLPVGTSSGRNHETLSQTPLAVVAPAMAMPVRNVEAAAASTHHPPAAAAAPSAAIMPAVSAPAAASMASDQCWQRGARHCCSEAPPAN